MPYTAAIVSPREELARRMQELLTGAELECLWFQEADAFATAFEGGIEQAYAERSFLHPYAGRRPDLLVADLGTPDALDGRELVANLLLENPAHDLLVLVESWRTDRIGSLVAGAAGNTVACEAWERRVEDPAWIATLQSQARRLARQNVRRARYRALRHFGRARPPGAEGRPVFLSHSSHQEALSYGVRRFLEMDGVRVWFSYTDNEIQSLPAGWLGLEDAALDAARVLVPLLSRGWLDSPYCVRELGRFRARAAGDPTLSILPVLVETQVRSERLAAELLARWPAPYAMAGIGAQARWLRSSVSALRVEHGRE